MLDIEKIVVFSCLSHQVNIVESIYVASAEDAKKSPKLLLSLPDRDEESYFASYPNTDANISPPIKIINAVDDVWMVLHCAEDPDPGDNIEFSEYILGSDLCVFMFTYVSMQRCFAPIFRRNVTPKLHALVERDPQRLIFIY